MTKKELIELALKAPLEFEATGGFKELVLPRTRLDFPDLREMIRRIYNMTERSLRIQSDASTGMIGWFNKRSTKKRIKTYYKKINNAFRASENPQNKVILAEGDSWFQFPIYVKDIIDWLIKKNDHYAIYSIAFGGDWVTNIIYEGKYIEELSIHAPDVFLMSGGGNDMVGGNKIAVMVTPDAQKTTPKYQRTALDTFNDLNDSDKDDILEGQRYIQKEFYSFIIMLKAQYHLILQSIVKSGLNMKILIQGYDYAIPCVKDRFSVKYPPQYFINRLVDTGKWLARPMAIKGITDAEIQRKIVKCMIFEFNEMLKEIADKFSNVYHIDCRGVAAGPQDWFDELHLTPDAFEKIAQVYSMVIDGKITGEKSIKVVKHIQQ